MLKRVSPDLTEADLIALATKKIGKWQAKETAHIAEQFAIESKPCGHEDNRSLGINYHDMYETFVCNSCGKRFTVQVW
jgi:transcription elongation factor Elf1